MEIKELDVIFFSTIPLTVLSFKLQKQTKLTNFNTHQKEFQQ